MNKIRRNAIGIIFILASILILPLTALGQDGEGTVPFVDGDMWTSSSHAEKISYIVGLSNLLDAEYAFQQRSGNAPSSEQSFIAVLWNNIDELTLDECINRIDRWYANNPGDMDNSVIDVIWLDMVEPNLE